MMQYAVGVFLWMVCAASVTLAQFGGGCQTLLGPGAAREANVGIHDGERGDDNRVLSCSWSPSGHWLAFVVGPSSPPAGQHVYTVFAQRAGKPQAPVRLTRHSEQSLVTWHPQRDVLAVLISGTNKQRHSLWLLSPTSPAAEPLAVFDTAPIGPATWEFSGKWIGFVCRSSGRTSKDRLALVDSTTGQQTNVHLPEQAVAPLGTMPTWSRDGNRIICGIAGGQRPPSSQMPPPSEYLLSYSLREGAWHSLRPDRIEGRAQWVRLPPGPRGPRWNPLRDDPGGRYGREPYLYYLDGSGRSFIVYVGYHYSSPLGRFLYAPYLLDLEGEALVKDVAEIGRVRESGQTGRWTFSADGDRVAWLSFKGEGLSADRPAPAELWVASALGRRPFERVTTFGGLYVGQAPAWHPDKEQVAVIQRGTREDKILVVDVRTQRTTPILTFSRRVTSPD